MQAVSWIDYTIIIVYMVLSLAVGLVMTRKASTSLEHYYLGGRSMPWWLLGVAGMTAWFDMTGTMVVTSFLYMLGPRGLYVEFRGGAVLVLAFLICYAGKWHRRSGVMTPAEWNIYRFGDGASAQTVRLIGAVVGLASTVGMLAYLVVGTNLFMGMFFPWNPLYSTLTVIAVTTIYTMCAGFYGMVLTDLVQGVIIMVSCVIVGFIAWHMIPSSDHLASVAAQVTGNADWVSSNLPVHTTMPKGYEDYSWLLMFAMFYLLRNIFGGMAGGAEARYFAAKNDRECGLQGMLQGITVMFRWPMMVGFAVMGIYLVSSHYPDMSVVDKSAELIHQYYPQVAESHWHDLTQQITLNPDNQPAELIAGLKGILGTDWTSRMPLISFQGTINPERILPAVLMESVPVGLKGLILVAMLAALMSTFTGTVNGAGALFVRDIWQNFLRPKANNRELITISWITSFTLVVLGIIMGLYTPSINKIWGWIIMSLGAGGLAPGLLRLYWWRLNAWGCLGGTVFGVIGSMIQYFAWPNMMQFTKMTPETQAWMTEHLPVWLVKGLNMPAEWQMFIVFSFISFAGAISFSLLTPPTDEKRLIHFYRTTRPFGFWGPIRKKVKDQEMLAKMDHENRRDIIAVPFTLLWQVTLFLLPMQLVIKSYGSFFRTLPLFGIAVAGMYWFWWRNLGPAGEIGEVPGEFKDEDDTFEVGEEVLASVTNPDLLR